MSYVAMRRSRQRRKRFSAVLMRGLMVMLFLAGLGVGGAWVLQLFGQQPDIASATQKVLSQTTSLVAPTVSSTPQFVPLDVQQRFQTVLQAYPNIKVGVVFEPANSSLAASVNSTQTFRAASTTKLITATYFLHQVEQGAFSLNQQLGTSTAQYQLQQMINQSNNDSWGLFLDLVGSTNEQAYAKQIGLSSFDVSTNSIAPADLASLLQQLYQGTLLNQTDTQLLLGYMQNTNDDTLILPAVPTGATVYHKYGELDDDVHDQAIIQYQGQTWVLVIMTNGRGVFDYPTRTQLIQALVKAAFNTGS